MIDTMKKLTPPAFAITLAMTLAGCMSLAPKYERPAAPARPASARSVPA